MAKKLSTLFFSTVKRMARLQRQALKTATRLPAKKRAAPARSSVARGGPTLKAPAPIAVAWAGTWQNLVHKTSPSHTELLGRLAYSLYRPPTRPIAGLPLVVMLHGCQQTAHDLALGTRMNRLADAKGFVVAYPQQTRRVQALRCWRWFQPDAAHGAAEADAIADLTRTLVARHRLDPARVYLAGMSAGACMAGLTALRHPRLFAAVAMHSGAVLGDAHSAQAGVHTMRHGAQRPPARLIEALVPALDHFPGMPVIILHGQRDRVVALLNARQLAQQFVYLNWMFAATEPLPKVSVMGAGTTREYLREDYLQARKPVVRLCLVKGAGHGWSGGDHRLKFHAKDGPNASLAMWRFFDVHRRDTAPLTIRRSPIVLAND